jgi:hypothetical protein
MDTIIEEPQESATDIWDDLFHWAAWDAFITEARIAQDWPDPEKVRQRAYATYEAEKRRIDKDAEPR